MTRPRRTILLLALVAAGCGTARSRPPAAATPVFVVRTIELPGAPREGVFMDYLAYDRTHHRLWVPAGSTGSVDVVSPHDDRLDRIEGFKTAEVERRGTKRLAGPSSAAIADDVVYIGNRGDNSVCAVGATSLQIGVCLRLESPLEGLAYVRSTREVWVTMPRGHAIAVIKVAGPMPQRTATIGLGGQPEGFAVDDGRGIFYTNLEDKDRTLAIDVKSHKVLATWNPTCGQGGPKGLALDDRLNVLMVACESRVTVLDAGHDGTPLSTLDTGDGLDNLDYVAARHELYAAAAHAATLTIAHLDPPGILTSIAVVATVPGARNAVASEDGTAYLTDSSAGRILVVQPSSAASQ
jgi:hypothetical protein